MRDIQYFVLIQESNTVSDEDRSKINEVKIEEYGKATKLPFSDDYIDIYLISHNKQECEDYIKNLNKDIQKYFYVKQVGNKIQYTAFIDILGFSKHIRTNITNDYLAQEFYGEFNKVIEYIKLESEAKFSMEDAEYLKDIKIKYSWVSDTFVVCIEYLNEIEEGYENNIKFIMIARLSIIVASIHHFMAKLGFIIRGAISSKYSCITNNFILGEGVAEASKLEKEIAIYPRVIFEKNIISDDIYKMIEQKYFDNDLNIISKDCDGYHFVNYIAMLLLSPPRIGNPIRLPEKYELKSKRILIKQYRQVVLDNIKNSDEKIKIKYMWLDNYLNRVLDKEEFQKNII